jgi:hypothetical protein
MKYMLLIYSDPTHWENISDAEREAIIGEYVALGADMRERNVYVDGSQLQPAESTTTVRVVAGETEVTDGPFAETKEALGGYYLIEAESLDEAIDWASRIPAASHGVIEVRPLVPARAEVSA